MAARLGGFSGHESLPGASRDGTFRVRENIENATAGRRVRDAGRNSGLSGTCAGRQAPTRTAGWISCAVGSRSGRRTAFGTSAPP
ncbi:hypothetical protein DIE18_00760 [Burkholderia sp. Bp9125]|nr:hypothetical protein DIE18_00760 [Burkholderia sp. Bp9125]